MKKKYTRCSASLFIGLLSLHTLSSCVNTGQTLGMSRHAKKLKEDRQELDKTTHILVHIPPDHRKYPHCRYCKPWYAKPLYQAAAGITTTALVGAGLFYSYMLSGSDLMEGTAANATTALAPTVETGVANMTNTTLASIRDTAETAAVTITTLLPTAGLIASLRPNGWNSNSSVATKPTELTELSDAIMYEIMNQNDWSKKKDKLVFWLDQGLDIDAKNHKGITLLMAAVMYQEEEMVEFIISKGANVNAQDNHGNTVLMYTKGQNTDKSKRIADRLITHKANPCLSNNSGQSFASDKISFSNANSEKLSEAMKQCKQ